MREWTQKAQSQILKRSLVAGEQQTALTGKLSGQLLLKRFDISGLLHPL